MDTRTTPFSFTSLPNMLYHHENAACGVSTSANNNQMHLIVAGGTPMATISEFLTVDKIFLAKNKFKWERGPDLPRGFIMGGSVSYRDNRGWLLVGGSDDEKKFHSDIIRYNNNTRKFELLPGKLKIGRSGFGALLAQVSDKC